MQPFIFVYSSNTHLVSPLPERPLPPVDHVHHVGTKLDIVTEPRCQTNVTERHENGDGDDDDEDNIRSELRWIYHFFGGKKNSKPRNSPTSSECRPYLIRHSIRCILGLQ